MLAMLMQGGYDNQARLIVCDLLSWILQKDPKKRPQSCAEMLQHPFFSTSAHSLDTDTLAQGLHLSHLHIAAALGKTAEVESILANADQELVAAQSQLLHRQPLHLAAAGGHVDVVRLLVGVGGEVARDATDDTGRTALQVVQHILADDVGGEAGLKTKLEEVRKFLAQVTSRDNIHEFNYNFRCMICPYEPWFYQEFVVLVIIHKSPLGQRIPYRTSTV